MADVPRDEPPEDPRPWEQLGAARRDRLPHRGDWLYPLARTAAIAGFVSVVAGLAAFTGPFTSPAMAYLLVLSTFYGLACGGAVLRAARHDLTEMRAGRMHTGGRNETRRAWDFALGGIVASASGLLASGCLLWARGHL